MNKKEVLEIKKQFSPENCAITRICGCYVDHEKNKQMTTKDAFLSLPEEETFKYFDIFKKTLSGSLGKNLLQMEFPLKEEDTDGTQEFLLRLRNSKLKDDELLDAFYDKIIENYVCEGNYYIVLIHAMYDIPGKTSDNMFNEDASDEVYEYLLCSICPVALSKAGLSYNAEDNRIQDRTRDWTVNVPDKGFIFPTFTDRTENIHEVLYYTKKTQDLQPEFIETIFGSNIPVSADDQKEQFQTLVSQVLGNDCDYAHVYKIQETLSTWLDEREQDEPMSLSKRDIRVLLENSEVSAENMAQFDDIFDNVIGNHDLLAENITDTKNVKIETEQMSVKVPADQMDRIETREIDGRKYLMIEVNDQIKVNGLNTKTKGGAGRC